MNLLPRKWFDCSLQECPEGPIYSSPGNINYLCPKSQRNPSSWSRPLVSSSPGLLSWLLLDPNWALLQVKLPHFSQYLPLRHCYSSAYLGKQQLSCTLSTGHVGDVRGSRHFGIWEVPLEIQSTRRTFSGNIQLWNSPLLGGLWSPLLGMGSFLTTMLWYGGGVGVGPNIL